MVLQFFRRPVRTNTPAWDIETNHTLNNEKIPFVNQIPIFFYQKLEVASKMTKPDLYIYIYIDMGLTTTSLWGSWVAARPSMHLRQFSGCDIK